MEVLVLFVEHKLDEITVVAGKVGTIHGKEHRHDLFEDAQRIGVVRVDQQPGATASPHQDGVAVMTPLREGPSIPATGIAVALPTEGKRSRTPLIWSPDWLRIQSIAINTLHC